MNRLPARSFVAGVPIADRIVQAILLSVTTLPCQDEERLVPAELIADLKRYDQCAEPRRRELAARVGNAFRLPEDCDVAVLECQTMPGKPRALPPDRILVELEATMTTSPLLTLRLLGDLEPRHPVRFGRGSRFWDGNETPREVAARLVSATRMLVREADLARHLVACRGLASSRGTSARYRLELPIGSPGAGIPARGWHRHLARGECPGDPPGTDPRRP